MKSNRTSTVYRPMKAGDEASVVDLVLNVFDRFVAPLYSEEGVAEFKKFVRVDDLIERVSTGNLVLLAEIGHIIIGVLEIHENSHIALLFVDDRHQRKGIAKTLIQIAIEICSKRNPKIESVTVNASPNAFTAYKKLGFKVMENEKVVNGIRFIPMALTINRDSGQRA